jgi:hypothetical protein
MAKDKGKGKSPKKCKNLSSSKRRRIPWYVFGGVGLATRGLAALALVVIACKMYPLKQEAAFFNGCVEDTRKNGKSVSAAVRFCNGGI